MDEQTLGRVGGFGPGRARGRLALEGEGGVFDAVLGDGVAVPFYETDVGDSNLEGVVWR